MLAVLETLQETALGRICGNQAAWVHGNWLRIFIDTVYDGMYDVTMIVSQLFI